MKSIAIISNFFWHFECLGFLLQSLATNDITVFHPNKMIYGNIVYFKKIFTFKSSAMSKFKEGDYDIIIKLTSHENIKIKNKKKLISIAHVEPKVLSGADDGSKILITLSPYVKIRPPDTTIFPIYNGIVKPYNFQKKQILYVGQFENSWFDKDFENFIVNSGFEFIFVISTGKGRGQPIKKYKNVTIINSAKMNQLIQYISNSLFMLCRKLPYQHLDRFSGAYSLALSHNIPMILQEQFANDYKIPCIPFKKDYCEIIDIINNNDIRKYEGYISQIKEYKENTINKNTKMFTKIIDSL